MNSIARMVWDCGICHLAWESKELAEWCCTEGCEQAEAHLRAVKDQEAEQQLLQTKFPVG